MTKPSAGCGDYQHTAQLSSAPKMIAEVDMVKQLKKLSLGKGLNWKVSIVDLLKLFDLDRSREARNELAAELGCLEGLIKDSAKMNSWLNKTVLKKIARMAATFLCPCRIEN